MAIEGLTEQQSDFVERFLKIPKFRKRDTAKARRREAIESFRVFNAECRELRELILTVEDPAAKSVLLGQLSQAEARSTRGCQPLRPNPYGRWRCFHAVPALRRDLDR